MNQHSVDRMSQQVVSASQEDEIIRRVKAKALAYDKLTGCSQSVLGALQEELGIGNKESFKAASVHSGGFRRGETCGAIIGALMGLGLVIGRERMEDVDTYQRAMAASEKVSQRFRKELQRQFGFKKELTTTLCREIMEKVMGRFYQFPDELEPFIAAGGHGDNGCPKVCAIAAQVAAEKILEISRQEE
ncbi:C-GCAxxG-C-C family protein [Chloroflexota bacterium]